MRTRRGWSWDELATRLRGQAQALRVTRIASAKVSSVKRTIARWEAGTNTPDEQYQLLLGHVYARTALDAVALGPGSDFREYLYALAEMGVDQARIDEVETTVVSAVTDAGMSLLAYLGAPLRTGLAAALAKPESLDLAVVDGLRAASDAVNVQIGSVPFVRLHLAQAAIVDACRHLLRGEHRNEVRTGLQRAASRAYALAARISFETHDDEAARRLYEDAVIAAGPAAPSQRALIRSSQTMVVYYSTGDLGQARQIADLAVTDARRGPSMLMRARAHALQAEMAARGEPSQHRHAHAALHSAWHDLDSDTSDDPMDGVFSKGRLRGFEGVCGIFLGNADAAAQQLDQSVKTLTRPRDAVQRAIVLTDHALARIRAGGAGSAEAAAHQLHECVDLTAGTRARVPAQRLQQARLELRPWRREAFVADLDDHILTALIGV
ncbi:hypothetical protein [Actinomadura sp. 6N118]|uniref:hypothetical protein n=1 Tax=Actinomadura sp. 6N118 TaxID=3375151 RepID=UPI00379AF0F9